MTGVRVALGPRTLSGHRVEGVSDDPEDTADPCWDGGLGAWPAPLGRSGSGGVRRWRDGQIVSSPNPSVRPVRSVTPAARPAAGSARRPSRRAGRAPVWARLGAVRELGCAPGGRASGRTRPWPGTAGPASYVLSALSILLAIYRVENFFKQQGTSRWSTGARRWTGRG